MKRTEIKRRPMADSVLNNLEPEEKAYRERDSSGLYFQVKPNGSKSWLLRYKRPNGKWAWLGLGGFTNTSGKVARKEAKELLELAADGVDLLVHRKGVQPEEVLFKTVAEEWYERKEKAGRSKSTLNQYRLYFERDVYPVIGDKGITQVTRADCAKIQSIIEARSAHVIAGKVRGWVSQVFSLAIGSGRCEINPASELKHIAQEGHKTKHHPHLLEPELPEFLQALKASESRPVTVAMVWLVIRTACRPGMARFAEWSEIDLDTGTWTIPAHKMKARREHVIPLSHQSVVELREVHQTTGRHQYVFPGSGPKNPTMSENTINKCLNLIGYKGKLVGHGARHTASTLLREHGWSKEWVESQLAHKEDGVAGVYNKAQYLSQRREMMQWYSDYIDALCAETELPADPVMVTGMAASMREAL